jgi:hypothetical protein
MAVAINPTMTSDRARQQGSQVVEALRNGQSEHSSR